MLSIPYIGNGTRGKGHVPPQFLLSLHRNIVLLHTNVHVLINIKLLCPSVVESLLCPCPWSPLLNYNLGQDSRLFCMCHCNYITTICIVEWSAPAVKNRPSPCGVIAFTRISDHHAVVFGGNYRNARSDDLFIFDLEHKVLCNTLSVCACVCVRVHACMCVCACVHVCVCVCERERERERILLYDRHRSQQACSYLLGYCWHSIGIQLCDRILDSFKSHIFIYHCYTNNITYLYYKEFNAQITKLVKKYSYKYY